MRQHQSGKQGRISCGKSAPLLYQMEGRKAMGKRINTAVWLEKYNRWQIKVQKDGKRRTFTSSKPGRNGQREANRKADEWLDDGLDGENLRVFDLYELYKARIKETTSLGNYRNIETYGTVWIVPIIGALRISKLTEANLQKVIDKAYAKGLSKKSLGNIRATLISFVKYCRKNKWTALFPEDLTIPQGARLREKKILQPSDISALFTTDTRILRGKPIFDDYVYAYRFQVLTGLRPGELIGLRWSDVDENDVFIKRSINIYGEETQGKNENAIRHFVLSPLARKILNDQRSLSTSESVFEIASTKSYWKRWKSYCESNNIQRTSLYELRHTFVSVVKALPEGQIKAIVGHSRNMDTFGTYSHEVEGELQETADRINDLFEAIIGSGTEK